MNMRKTIFIVVVAVLLSWGATAQTMVTKDHYITAKQLYEVGRWSAAQAELASELHTVGADNIDHRMEVETLYALCAAQLGQAAAGELMAGVLIAYPNSPYTDEVRFRAGVFEFDRARYTDALTLLLAVDSYKLPKSEFDEYNFTLAQSYFSIGSYDNSRLYFEKVSPNSSYAPHAEYHIAYIDYLHSDYERARDGFFDLASDPSYQQIVPYYLFQIEFMTQNWRYVVENGNHLIGGAVMPRKAELVRMVAEGWFHLNDYAKALQYIETYRTLEGKMGRPENYIEGFSLYNVGRWNEASEALALATGADDRLSQNASYHLADVYLRLGDKQRAMQSFSIASTAGYDEAIAEDALFNYGKLQYELGGGHFNEAINILNRYIELYPSSPRINEVREYLISAYYNSHNYEAAYNAIIQYHDPDNNIRTALQKITYFRALELWKAGNNSEALRLLATSASFRYNAKYTALANFWQGEILYSEGDYNGAIPKYKEYLRLSPTSERENTLARYNLGYAYFNLQEWSEANSWFTDFLDRYSAADAFRADAFNREGDIAHAERHYWQAIESYDKATKIGTDERYYSAYQRAMMLGLVERPERKIESLQAIITAGKGPYIEDAMYELARTYIARERYTEGAKTLEQFIEKYPTSAHYLVALSDLGLAYLNMGDRKKSMQYYKMIVDYAPHSRESQDAMAGIRGLYIDSNDVDGYFAYARQAGVTTDAREMNRDSLLFVAAEKIYLSGDRAAAIPALKGYVSGNAKGRYLPAALYYLSDAQIRDSDAAGAIATLTQLTSLKRNDYTIRGLQRLAELNYNKKNYTEAAQNYRTLWEATTDKKTISSALEGYVASILATKDDSLIVAMADEVATIKGVPVASLRQARFAKAGILARGKQTEQAMAIYADLSQDVGSAEGAESAYRVIEHQYEEGKYEDAESSVFAFSEKNTPHSYWLGEAFLTLGDIYARKGDSFQARATWQSIVDGYSPADDGIVAAARERIANLK
jgi:TolA-binding protein